MQKSNPTHVLFHALATGSTSDAIEHSEQTGQKELTAQIGERIQLPSQGLIHRDGVTADKLAALGILVGNVVDGDPLFTWVTVPTGWKLERTDHAMWSKLVDGGGRVRAHVFYKASFYDRRSHIDWSPRYQIKIAEYGYESDLYQNTDRWTAVVLDAGVEIHRCVQLIGDMESYDAEDMARAYAAQWLDYHYPDWRNPLAYWR